MEKRIKRLLSRALPAMAVLLIWSCYPSGPSNVSQADIIVTLYDSQFNFGTVKTYALPDTVFDLAGSGTISHQYDSLILSEVDKNMAQLGYVKELDPEHNGADAILVVSAAKQTTASADYPWYTYWGSWSGWAFWGSWDSSWGIHYPWPPGEVFTTGSIFIEMVDPNGRDTQNKKLPARWSGIINGLLASTSTDVSAQIVSSIDQCYAQSPYLGK